MVAVYVSHDPDKDEWICQIPYFPPFQSPEVSVCLFTTVCYYPLCRILVSVM